VGIGKRVGNLADITGDGIEVKLFARASHFVYAFTQGATAHKRHNQVSQLFARHNRFIILKDWQDIFVFEPGYRIGLAPETLEIDAPVVRVHSFRWYDDFYGHRAHRARLLRYKNSAHTAAPYDTFKGAGAKRDANHFVHVHR
jgi:hypothetical protein